MLGYSRRDIEGKHFIQFIPASEAASATLLFNDLIQGSLTDFRREIRLSHKDGNTVWTSATFAGVLTGKHGRPDFVVAFAENITRRKEVENEMVEMKSQLQYSAEEERRRLARELHDGPVQELYGALFQIEGLRSKLPEEDQEACLNIKHDIQTAIRELRSMSKDLR